MKYTKAIAPFVGVLLLAGCQLPRDKQTATGKAMIVALEEGYIDNAAVNKKGGTRSLPENVKMALRPSLQSSQRIRLRAPEKQFDLFAEQVPARTFFLSLVENTGYNITIHPDVDGKISLQLKRVTIPEVLDTIRNVYGYDFKQTPQGIEVLPATLQTRAFSVNYLDVNRGGKSETQVTAGTLKSSGAGGASNGSTTSGGTTTSSTGSSGSSLTVNSKITTSSTTNFWEELKIAVQTIIGNGDGRQVAISPLSSLIVVQAMPNELKRVEAYLKSADLALNRQVILEAKILEVELNDSFQAGINWSLVSGRINSTQFGGNVIAKPLNAGDTFPSLNSNLSGGMNIIPGQVTQTVPASSAGVFGGAFALSMNFKNLSSFIEVLGAQGKVHVLSSPRVSTLNNQKALIKVGSDKFFITNVSSTTTSIGTNVQVSPSVTFDSFFSGIALDVTPNITNEDEITLHIHPTISDVQDDLKSFTLGKETQSYPLAKSSVRESDSMVKAKSGEMVVIGGLMQNQNSEKKEGIPLLKDLPVFGHLFRHTVQVAKKSELVILLKPTVVRSDTWSEAVDNTLDRFQKINEEIEKDDNRFHCKGPHCRKIATDDKKFDCKEPCR
ncbi:MAG TPA: pilus (MSHA type) biogenesis protein MshL [Gammaproteobacteria bacterium]|nr:pilus (MSHA type) biogenesis protein MshL [Gammaproteobacteria bacterium]